MAWRKGALQPSTAFSIMSITNIRPPPNLYTFSMLKSLIAPFAALVLLLGQFCGALWFTITDGLAAALVFFVAWAVLVGLIALIHSFFGRLLAPLFR